MAKNSRYGLQTEKLKNNRRIVHVDPTEAVERQFLHVAKHTLLLLRFGLNSDRYSLKVKPGVLNTFAEFMDPNIREEFEVFNVHRDAAISQALQYLSKKIPDLNLEETDLGPRE